MASADELLESIRRSPHDRSPADLDRLLQHFGFDRSEGGNHTTYRHPALGSRVAVQVHRHRRLRDYVARQAVRAVDLVRPPVVEPEETSAPENA